MLEDLQGYTIQYVRHAQPIFYSDFKPALTQLYKVLDSFGFTDLEIIQGGGGESVMTQRLRHIFEEFEWRKREIVVEHLIDGESVSGVTHEVDHYKTFPNGRIGLEIEWNNKDPFYDRDLENFRSIHSVGGLSLGIIITRGSTLQQRLMSIYVDFFNSLNPQSIDDLRNINHMNCRLNPTGPQLSRIAKHISKGASIIEASAKVICKDKFGTSTTHWDKLIQRIERGVGNPCPLILIGIEYDRVSRSIIK